MSNKDLARALIDGHVADEMRPLPAWAMRLVFDALVAPRMREAAPQAKTRKSKMKAKKSQAVQVKEPDRLVIPKKKRVKQHRSWDKTKEIILRALAKNPGVKAADIAKTLKVNKTYAYGLIHKAKQEATA